MEYNRYLVNFDTDDLPKETVDAVVIGTGIAGLYAAVAIDRKYKLKLISKGRMEFDEEEKAINENVVLSLDRNDSMASLREDTIYGGAGLCNKNVVDVYVEETEKVIEKLKAYGVEIKPDAIQGADGDKVKLGKAAKRETRRKLSRFIAERDNIEICENSLVVDLLTENGTCHGVLLYDTERKEFRVIYAKIVICASGGYGGLFEKTTSSDPAMGDGQAFAFRAGAELMDMEFVHFYPLVVTKPGCKPFIIPDKILLEGASLRNSDGERFMKNHHELGDAAPRADLSRCIFEEMQQRQEDNVYLDVTFKDRAYLQRKYSDAYESCMEIGIDMAEAYVPVAPAEYYCIGGIKADENGRTNVRNFFVCGEAACNGIHGASGAACNSLMEGIVFSDRIAQVVDREMSEIQCEEKHIVYQAVRDNARSEEEVLADLRLLRHTLFEKVGIIRDADSLLDAVKVVVKLKGRTVDTENRTPYDFTLQNDILLAQALIESAMERRESRGVHFRRDYPFPNEQRWRKNIIRKIY